MSQSLLLVSALNRLLVAMKIMYSILNTNVVTYTGEKKNQQSFDPVYLITESDPYISLHP